MRLQFSATKICVQWLAALALAMSASLTLGSSPAAQTQAWPDNPKLSGNAFLPPGLRKLQDESATSPISVWLDRGRALWADSSNGPSCQSCHASIETLKNYAANFPRLTAKSQSLINLEDQIIACSARSGRTGPAQAKPEDDDAGCSAAARCTRVAGTGAVSEGACQRHAGRGAVDPALTMQRVLSTSHAILNAQPAIRGRGRSAHNHIHSPQKKAHEHLRQPGRHAL